MEYDTFEGTGLKKPRIEDFSQTYFYKEGEVLTEEKVKELCPIIKFPLPVKFNSREKAALKNANIIYQTTANKEAFLEAIKELQVELEKREKLFKTVLFENAFDNLRGSPILQNAKILPLIYEESRAVKIFNDVETLDATQTHRNFKKNLQFARVLFSCLT